MGELLTLIGHFDVSPIIAVLLVSLAFTLRAIAKSVMARLECAEARIEELEGYKQRHETSLAVIKTRLEIVEDHDT